MNKLRKYADWFLDIPELEQKERFLRLATVLVSWVVLMWLSGLVFGVGGFIMFVLIGFAVVSAAIFSYME